MTYLEAEIFSDNRINAIADKLFYFISTSFNLEEALTKFCLSGSSAYMLQNSEPTASNVVFVVSDQEIYNYLASNIKKITQATTAIIYKERILLDFVFIKIEIWFFETELDLIENNSDDIYLQNQTQIPLYLL